MPAIKEMLDTMLKYQNKQLREYECYSCGKYATGDKLEDRTWHDQGERFDAQICTDCIRRGWDEWGRP